MADGSTFPPATHEGLIGITEALGRAEQELFDLQRIQAQGPAARIAGDVGTYLIPPDNSWQTLLSLVQNPVHDIDFSPRNYPGFDAIVEENFDADAFINPLNDKYESYKNLRDNLAAVRNYLLMVYFERAEDVKAQEKAEDILAEIASFLGNGLHNNYLFFGLVPNHNPFKAHIDINAASAPNGAGAEYLYECILKQMRHNNWTRPFARIGEMFGGKAVNDWDLPPLHVTPFAPENAYPNDMNSLDGVILAKAHEIAYLEELKARTYTGITAREQLFYQAVDLDALGNELLYAAADMHNVGTLSEPVRRDAIDIARDILEKLKVSFGNVNVLDGLKLKPDDDTAVVGAVKGVLLTFERLLGVARGVDPRIFEHPAILSATQAFGQIGYLAKLEALRIASAIGEHEFAEKISTQLQRIPNAFAQATDATFGGLVNRIQNGINTVLVRMQTITGPGMMVGHSIAHADQAQTPTAGQSQQLSLAAQQQARLQTEQQQAIQQGLNDAQRKQAQMQAQRQAQRAQRQVERGQQRQQQVNMQRAQTQAQAAKINANMVAQPHQDHHAHDAQHSLANAAKAIDPGVLANLLQQQQAAARLVEQQKRDAAAKAAAQQNQAAMAAATKPAKNMYGQVITAQKTGAAIKTQQQAQLEQATREQAERLAKEAEELRQRQGLLAQQPAGLPGAPPRGGMGR